MSVAIIAQTPVFVALADLTSQPGARRAFARDMIAERLGCAPARVALAHDAQGAPQIAAPACALHMSLSSRDSIGAFALGARPVGVDVEIVGPAFAPPWGVLHARERRMIEADADAHRTFLRIWTAKEAYLKALGVGLAREPAEIEIRLGEEPMFDVWDAGRKAASAQARSLIVAHGAAHCALAWVELEAPHEKMRDISR